MKFRLLICLLLFSACFANAAGAKRVKQELPRLLGQYTVCMKAQKAFYSPIRKGASQQSETVHRDNCNRSVSQCRTYGNDNIISAQTLPLALIICTRSLHVCPSLPDYYSTLRRLLLFPNHYFW